MLSYGGKEVLITSVLQSVPIYVLSTIVPPICVIRKLHKIFAKFFWSNKVTSKSKHWAAWEKVCLPKQEGGLGFRSMFDVSKAMYAKLWWRFRTQNTLWANFMWNKYYKKYFPTLVQWKSGSQVWKNMLQNKECIKKFIWWEPKGGTSTFWFDNWTQLGSLYTYQTEAQSYHSLMDIDIFMKEIGWDDDSILDHLPDHTVEYIRQHMDHVKKTDMGDRPWWIHTSTGKFSIKSSWEILRKK